MHATLCIDFLAFNASALRDQVQQSPAAALPHASERLQQLHHEALEGPRGWAWKRPDGKQSALPLKRRVDKIGDCRLNVPSHSDGWTCATRRRDCAG